MATISAVAEMPGPGRHRRHRFERSGSSGSGDGWFQHQPLRSKRRRAQALAAALHDAKRSSNFLGTLAPVRAAERWRTISATAQTIAGSGRRCGKGVPGVSRWRTPGRRRRDKARDGPSTLDAVAGDYGFAAISARALSSTSLRVTSAPLRRLLSSAASMKA